MTLLCQEASQGAAHAPEQAERSEAVSEWRKTKRTLASIRPVRLDLWSDGAMIGRAQIVCDDGPMPEVIMVDGLPFVPDTARGPNAWRRVRPYCIATPER